jgi:dihydrolipoamide dehydrogenase
VRVLDSTGFLALPAMPRSLIVVGGGFIGLEMAQAAHRLGANITIVDALPRVAGPEDREVSRALEAVFRRMGWELRLGVQVTSVTTQGDSAVLTMQTSAESAGEELAAECALVAVGRRPNSADLGLESLCVELSGPASVRNNEYLEAAPACTRGRRERQDAAGPRGQPPGPLRGAAPAGKGGKAPLRLRPGAKHPLRQSEVLRVASWQTKPGRRRKRAGIARAAHQTPRPGPRRHSGLRQMRVAAGVCGRHGRWRGLSRMAESAALRCGRLDQGGRRGLHVPAPHPGRIPQGAMLADKEAA